MQRVVRNIRQQRDDVVPAGVLARVRADVADRRQVFRVRLPRLPGCHEVPDDVVVRDDPRVVVVVRDDLADGHHEVVTDRRVRIGVVLRRQTVLLGQTLEVRHGRAVGHSRIGGVLLDHHDDMPEQRHGIAGHGGPPVPAARQRGERHDRGHARDHAHCGSRSSD